jgi:1,2-dihydroxy-3-keto-5-methylthiopentene dioxygenase
MATLRLPDEDRTIADDDAVRAQLAELGITYERWAASAPVADDTPAEEVLEAYGEQIDRLKAEGGYTHADVIELRPDTPGLDGMLDKFKIEHWHDEDEVRFIISGSGVFHFSVPDGPVLALEVEPGDLVRVPRGTNHWFDLCQTREIRAIRLFQDMSGWTPHYTGSGVDAGYMPLCMGPAQIPYEDIHR